MGSRDRYNYPPAKKNHSCHHIAYPYHSYRGELEHRRYQHNTALLISTPNDRHNLGYMTIHHLIDDEFGPPPKPNYYLMGDAIDFMESLDQSETRISRLGKVIEFFIEVADDEVSTFTADQARDIAEHYAMQKEIIDFGGRAYLRKRLYEPLREAA